MKYMVYGYDSVSNKYAHIETMSDEWLAETFRELCQAVADGLEQNNKCFGIAEGFSSFNDFLLNEAAELNGSH